MTKRNYAHYIYHTADHLLTKSGLPRGCKVRKSVDRHLSRLYKYRKRASGRGRAI